MKLRALVAAPLALFIGCSGDYPEGEESIGTVEQEAVVCAKGETLPGIDVSYWQGSINWDAVKGSGKVYAIARISDGTYMDTRFDTNWAEMKRVGLIRGAYQFFRPGQDVNRLADIVIAKVGKLGDGDLPVTIDVEATDGQSAATIVSKMKTWIAKVEAGTGKKPIIYSGKYFWQDNVGNSKEFLDHPLWIPAYGPTCPNLPDGTWPTWTFFQFTDSSTVPGISGGVDGDKFNGSLADLQRLAGGGADYAAQFVSQSWPFATMSFPLTVTESRDAYIELKNVGKKAWDSNTRLATTVERDRASAFTGPTWVSATRLAAVSGTVPPGGSYKFQFKWHAPATPGSFDEHFGLVQDGVAWFGDQGGPTDGTIQAKIDVVAAKYAAEFVTQSFPRLDSVLPMKVGGRLEGYVELKNIGTETWKAGQTKLAPFPRDAASPLAGNDWLSPTRIASPTSDVPPGRSYRFPVSLTTTRAGDYVQPFAMIEEGVEWFVEGDHGGVHVVAGDVTPAGDDAGVPPAASATASADVEGSCGCSTPGGTRATAPAALGLIALLLVRRRRS